MTTDAVPVLIPQLYPNDEDVLLVGWRVAERARVAEGDLLLEVESAKAVFDICAPAAGFVCIAAPAGVRLPVGARVAWIAQHPDFRPAEEPPTTTAAAAGVRFTKKAAKLIRTHELASTSFAGPVVREEDVLEHLGRPSPYVPPYRRLALVPHKRGEIRRLHQSGCLYSSVTLPVPLAPVARRLAAPAERSLTLGELLVWVCGQTLPAHARFNACCEQEALLLYEPVHVAYGMRATDRPLLAPVVRAVESLTLVQVSEAIKDLMLRYQRQELGHADLEGATFTVSDMGSTGATHFQPLLTHGQTAVLGICAPQPPGDWFNLVLGFDHRAADGVEAAALLTAIRAKLCDEPGAQDP